MSTDFPQPITCVKVEAPLPGSSYNSMATFWKIVKLLEQGPF